MIYWPRVVVEKKKKKEAIYFRIKYCCSESRRRRQVWYISFRMSTVLDRAGWIILDVNLRKICLFFNYRISVAAASSFEIPSIIFVGENERREGFVFILCWERTWRSYEINVEFVCIDCGFTLCVNNYVIIATHGSFNFRVYLRFIVFVLLLKIRFDYLALRVLEKSLSTLEYKPYLHAFWV